MLGLIDRFRAPVEGGAIPAWLGEHVYAHRGLHGDGRLENSPSAFAAAIERGLGIECDVQETADKRAVVFHDFTLERLTATEGSVRDKSVGELTAITLSGTGGETIPTLRDLCGQISGKVPLLIEIKSKRERRVANLCLAVRRVLEGYNGPVAVMSFNPRVGAWFARQAPQVTRGLVMTEQDARTFTAGFKRHAALWHAKPHFLAYDIRDLPSRFAAAQRKRGLPVLTWTVKSQELRARAELHADAPIAEGAGLP